MKPQLPSTSRHLALCFVLLLAAGTCLAQSSVVPLVASIPKGTDLQFLVTKGKTIDLQTGPWTSSSPSVASISNSGLATARNVGATTISFRGFSARLTVTPAALVSITVQPAALTIANGFTGNFTANGLYTDGSVKDVTALARWNSSANSVAAVNHGSITTSRVGIAVVTAAVGTASANGSVIVTPAVMISLVLQPSDMLLRVGASGAFTASALYSDGSMHDATHQANWRSSQTSVAAVDQNACVTSMAPGQVYVSATIGSVSTKALVESVTPVTDLYVGTYNTSALDHLSVDPMTGSVSPLDQLSLAPANLRAAVVAPSNRALYVADLVSNSIQHFALDPNTGASSFGESISASGQGPVALVIHPSGQYLYAVNALSNTVSGFTIDASTGVLTAISGSPVATGTAPTSAAITPDGTHLFVTNMSANTVSSYTIDQNTGNLQHVGDYNSDGINPYSVVIDPAGAHLYTVNIGSTNVSSMTIGQSGDLAAITGSPLQIGTMPMFMTLSSSGMFGYVADQGTGSIDMVSVDPATGGLTSLGTQVSGLSPSALAMDPAGSFLYVANSWSGSAAMGDVSKYDVNPVSGTLTFVSKGTFNGWPKTLALGSHLLQ